MSFNNMLFSVSYNQFNIFENILVTSPSFKLFERIFSDNQIQLIVWKLFFEILNKVNCSPIPAFIFFNCIDFSIVFETNQKVFDDNQLFIKRKKIAFVWAIVIYRCGNNKYFVDKLLLEGLCKYCSMAYVERIKRSPKN